MVRKMPLALLRELNIRKDMNTAQEQRCYVQLHKGVFFRIISEKV